MTHEEKEIMDRYYRCRDERRRLMEIVPSAAAKLTYTGLYVPSPEGINQNRWHALLKNVLINGMPTHTHFND